MKTQVLQESGTTPTTGTMAEYAEHSGLAYATIRNYGSCGKLVFAETAHGGAAGAAGKTRLVDFPATDALLMENASRARRSFRPASTPAHGDAVDVEYRKNLALARRREVELAQLEGKLVEAEEVRGLWVKVLAIVKTGVLRIPDRAAQQVAASSDMREIRAILERECETALKGIGDEILSAGN